MTLPTSRLAYTDCFELFDKALESEKGIRLAVEDHDTAFRLRTRMHYARSIDRDDNRVIHEEGSNLHGRSIYDPLVCRIKNVDGDFFLYIEKNQFDEAQVEDLAGLDDGA